MVSSHLFYSKGFECGIVSGNFSGGFISACGHIKFSVVAGVKLPTILEKIDAYLAMMNKHGNQRGKAVLLLFRDTVSILMGKECTINMAEEEKVTLPDEVLYYHRALRAFWKGHYERSNHFAERVFEGLDEFGGGHYRIVSTISYLLQCSE